MSEQKKFYPSGTYTRLLGSGRVEIIHLIGGGGGGLQAKESAKIHAGWGMGIMVQTQEEAEQLSESPKPKASEIAADRLGFERFDYCERS